MFATPTKKPRYSPSFSTGSQQISAENDRTRWAQDDQQHGSGDDDEIGFDPVAAMASLDLGGDGEERKKGDEMQELAISIAERGENLFLTGRAGTGKSWTTQQIVKSLQRGKKNHLGKKVHVTAPTGIAAINVDGTTIHRWGGFGLGHYYSDYDNMLAKEAKKRIRETDVLVFDEVSMLSGHMFDVLEYMTTIIRNYDDIKQRLKDIRNNAPRTQQFPTTKGGATAEIALELREAVITGKRIHEEEDQGGDADGGCVDFHMLKMRWKAPECGGLGDLPPWGGMQIVLVGDFFQLPPIPKNESHSKETTLLDEELIDNQAHLKVGRQGTYAFQSRSWSRSNLRVVDLVKVHRQAQDGGLLDLLNDIREGKANLCAEHKPAINAIRSPLPEKDDGIVPTELHSRNREVDKINESELNMLPGDSYSITSKDTIVLDDRYKTRLLKKYTLKAVEYMPHLWAPVESPNYPDRWEDAKHEVEALKEKKKKLLADEKYEEIGLVRDKLDAVTKEIIDIDREVKEKSIITISTITEWLKENPFCSESANQIYDKIVPFQTQLIRDYGEYMDFATKRFFRDECRVRNKLELKVNSQVMLIWNLSMERKLVNGSRGVVLGFIHVCKYKDMLEQELHRRQKEAGQRGEKEMNSQHASNSKDKEFLRDLSSADKTTPAIENKETHPSSSAVNDDVTSQLNAIIIQYVSKLDDGQIQSELRAVENASSHMNKFPLVKFATESRLILPTPFAKEFRGFFQATRSQLPLVHAWAISIHKSQGMTIDRLKVDLGGCFSPGQAYVACSRGRSTATMHIENFSESQILTSDAVKTFYSSLARGEEWEGTTWADSLGDYSNMCHQKVRMQHLMTRKFGSRICRLCNSPCVVKMITSDKNGNRGKWYVKCRNGYGSGHCFEILD